jgi:hypothetical protein
VGDFIINFHDRFHLTSDLASQPGLSGAPNYGSFDNSIGMLVTWDLNKAVLSLNYDHLIWFATKSDYNKIYDHSSDLVSLRAAWLVTPATPLGLEFGAGTTVYDQDILDDLFHYSFGAFYEVPAGQFSNLRLAVGYAIYDPTTHRNTNSPSSTMDAVYAELAWNHRITQHITYSISAGQQMQTGTFSELLKMYYARLIVRWDILHGYSLSTSFGYENGDQDYVSYTEHFERYSAGITLSKQLSRKLSASLGYTFYDRLSDHAGDYLENRLSLNISYNF